MKIVIIGTGYVGLVTGACFAEMGLRVVCVDVDGEKIARLSRGDIPIYEPNLDSLVAQNASAGRLSFSTDLAEAMDGADVAFLAVGTPPGEDGAADLGYVLAAARQIGSCMKKYALVVTKSTVPVGTSERVREAVRGGLASRGLDIPFDVASNPEFLKEGSAIDDFMRPDRVVVGVDSPRAKEIMASLYRPMLLNNFRVIFMDIASAEMTKYASNAMLATRISFMNDIANLCELVGADVDMVRSGMGSDSRIGSKFLYAGCGYGGSCFPKDVKALVRTAREKGYPMRVLESVEAVNAAQKGLLFKKFERHFGGDVRGRRVAVWGLAFKPGTDDMREAPSLELISALLEAGCEVSVYDPVAMDECRRRIGDSVRYAGDAYDCAAGACAIFHVTEWKEFRMPDWGRIRSSMSPDPVIIDGRNVLSLSGIPGFKYIRFG